MPFKSYKYISAPTKDMSKYTNIIISAKSSIAYSDSSLHLWHESLGHMSPSKVKLIHSLEDKTTRDHDTHCHTFPSQASQIVTSW